MEEEPTMYDYEDDLTVYDSEYSQYYYEVANNSSTWADPDPKRCGCKGSGWWVSAVDTLHRCPFHGEGVAHPDACASEEDSQESLEQETVPSASSDEEEQDLWDGDNIPF